LRRVASRQVVRLADAERGAQSSHASAGLPSIADISMTRPFLQSASRLHYWFRTWKVPRLTISITHARSAGARASRQALAPLFRARAFSRSGAGLRAPA
jgi:hypothetical protein